MDDPIDSSPDDVSVDTYAEAGAGIGTIAAGLGQVDPATVRRFLDVGCNYGYALDLGRFLHGWDVVGVEPSYAGKRGASDLDLAILPVYLDDEVDVGPPFDLVLASEVLEHVPDPRAFVQMLSRRLTPGGTLVLTTPAAEIVRDDEPVGDVLIALSPGYHVFLASARGLEGLLREAGFRSVQVVRERGTLRAAASLAVGRDFRAEPFDEDRLEPYYDMRAGSGDPGSALRLGMAVRHLRLLVSRGRWSDAAVSARRAVAAMRERYGLDLTDPARTMAVLPAEGVVPWSLPGLSFALGMEALVASRRPELAAQYFRLVIAAADRWEQQAGVLDLDSVDLRFQAHVHLGLALVHVDPHAAVATAADLAHYLDPARPGAGPLVAMRQARILVDLVALGHYDAAAELVATVAAGCDALSHDEGLELRRTGLDALYSLGILLLNRGEPAQAADWFRRCATALSAAPVDEHSTQLAQSCARHLSLAESRLSSPSGTRAEPAVAALSFRHGLDVYWSDASGTYLEGWALVPEAPAHRVEVRIGARTVDAERRHRGDLPAFFPDVPHAAEAGFSVYLPGRPRPRIRLLLHTPLGSAEVAILLPREPKPSLPSFPRADDSRELFRETLAAAPPGPLLLVGQRQPSREGWEALLADLGTDRDVVGTDIHPGWGVDVVADAHRLSAVLGQGRFAAVMSASLLEHVTAPWLVAAECARVLKPGGISYQVAPWVWPTHAMPNDFWRMSPEGLEQLFGPGLGFEVVASGGTESAVVVPHGEWRSEFVKMPTTASNAMSWAISRKVGQLDPAVSWPYDDVTGPRRARDYPVDGLVGHRGQGGTADE